MPRRYPPEFRRRVLDLIAGRPRCGAARSQSTAPGSFGHPTSAWMMAREVVQDGGGG